MHFNTMFKYFAATTCLAIMISTAYADELAMNLNLPTDVDFHTQNSRLINSHPYVLALNEVNVVKGQEVMSAAPSSKFEPPFYTVSNTHKYLGLGTLALAIATAVAPKPPEIEDRAPTPAEKSAQDSSTHAKLGRATAALAVATVTTGLLSHWDDFHLEDGIFDPDNQHALLGTLGALAMLYAVSKAPGEGHAGMGMAGGVTMGVAVKLTW